MSTRSTTGSLLAGRPERVIDMVGSGWDNGIGAAFSAPSLEQLVGGHFEHAAMPPPPRQAIEGQGSDYLWAFMESMPAVDNLKFTHFQFLSDFYRPRSDSGNTIFIAPTQSTYCLSRSRILLLSSFLTISGEVN